MDSNKQEIIAAIDKLNEIELAILRERILTITEYVLNNKEVITEQLKNGFIAPELYINACEHIFNEFNFKDQNNETDKTNQ